MDTISSHAGLTLYRSYSISPCRNHPNGALILPILPLPYEIPSCALWDRSDV